MRHSGFPITAFTVALPTKVFLFTLAIQLVLGYYAWAPQAHASKLFDSNNCYSFAEYRVGTLPAMRTMLSEAKPILPKKGDLALFYYEKSGLPHIAVVEHVFDNGAVLISEANMYHLYSGGTGVRFMLPSYRHLIGFYTRDEPRQIYQI